MSIPLDSDAKRHRGRIGCCLLAVLTAVCIWLLVYAPPELSPELANGTYRNACCSDVLLKDGILSYDGHSVAYVIRRDKVGAYILPSKTVGVLDGREVVFQGTDNHIKLRLDDPEKPQAIEIGSWRQTGARFEFVKIDH